MNKFTKLATSGAAIALALTFSASAMGGTIQCDPGDPARMVTLTDHDATSISCGPTGSTPPSEGTYFTGEGYTELEKIDDLGNSVETGSYILEITGLGGTSGTISLVAGLVDAILVFKFGSGGISPDWISFEFTGLTTANWSVTGSQALSHVTLYGTPPMDVPEPTTLGLMGLGLLGMGYRLRRRRNA
jgi:hypothetical protein